LRRQKLQVNERALDLLIAVTAIDHGLILVIRNLRDYDDIPGMTLYRRS
jgi:predicted nucleic acid-binding protein